MGITCVSVHATGPSKRVARVRMLVDSGAAYSLLPERIWKRLGLKPKRREQFELADGRTVARDVSECHFRIGKTDGHAPVILGDPGDSEPLLGVITLENLGLVFDPFARRLIQMRLVLASATSPTP
ncbi:MAG: aspartyl protease family protein [Planctomycetes bacterium]|nr:aspartyl protease family protein [Planctomycetota bacterium]